MEKVIQKLTANALECNVYQLFNQLQLSIFSIVIDVRIINSYHTTRIVNSIHIPLHTSQHDNHTNSNTIVKNESNGVI